MNIRLPRMAGCAALAAAAAAPLAGCGIGLPSGALAATAGSGAVADVSGAPLLVAPEDIGDHGHGFGHRSDAHFGGERGGAFDSKGALGKGR